jgi:N-acetylmuramoyl-L-alanine amidase
VRLLATGAWSFIFLLFTLEAHGSPKILDIRHWSAPDQTRIVLDLSGPISYQSGESPDSLTLGWWIEKAVVPGKKKIVSIQDQVVKNVCLQAFPSRRVRITIALVQPAQANVFTLKKYLGKPDRLVIDLVRPDLEGKEKDARKDVRGLKTKKIRIVVIDPGHGGEDPGTIGLRGTKEKDIVLAIGRKFKKILDQEEGIRAFLTRQGDYFIPLAERVRIARDYGADLFLSLHCNGNRRTNLRGTSVYCLSLKGASNVATRLLAEKENASDRMGGVSGKEGATRILDSILLDLQRTNAVNASLRLGGIVLRELRRVNTVQDDLPRQAEFAVLKAEDFPSILVECAYLTHPKEEFFLKHAKFQNRLARALAESVKKFLPLLTIQEGQAGSMVWNHGTSSRNSLR